MHAQNLHKEAKKEGASPILRNHIVAEKKQNDGGTVARGR